MIQLEIKQNLLWLDFWFVLDQPVLVPVLPKFYLFVFALRLVFNEVLLQLLELLQNMFGHLNVNFLLIN